MISFFVTLLVLGIVIFVHEWGHFIIARLCKLPILRFSIGFGPAIFEYKDRKKTLWTVSGLPLGGYVHIAEKKMFGFTKIIVSLAGPMMNFLLAFVLFTGTIYHIGRPTLSSTIVQVLPNSLAALNDIRPNDKVLKINHLPFEQIHTLLKKNDTIHLHIQRNIEILEKDIVLKEPKLGIVFGIHSKSVSFLEAIQNAYYMVLDLSIKIIRGIFSVIGIKNMGGLGTLFSISKSEYQAGWPSFFIFVGAFSINLGILNLLPFPPLDGGHTLMGLYEMMTQRRLNKKLYLRILFAGAFTIFGFFIISLINDLGWRF